MPDYRTIPPTIEGPCRYSLTGKCCVTENGKPLCPPDRCDPPDIFALARQDAINKDYRERGG